MDKPSTFAAFYSEIKMDSADVYSDDLSGIASKLNKHYYNVESDSENLLLVGSVGRGTAVKGTSDVDALFVLPREVYNRFNSHKGNGQSSLLQEMRNVLLERYSKTDIKGDGQAVVVNFISKGYTIDLVPAFSRDDGAFDFPNSIDGGSWKKTDPIPEQNACAKADAASSGNFVKLCNSLRVWKENQGLKFSGLLIDTLVDSFLSKNPSHKSAGFSIYDETLLALFDYLSKEDANQPYWHALGSGQQVTDSGKCEFISKAALAAAQIEKSDDDAELENAFKVIFGKRFSDCIVDSLTKTQQEYWKRLYAYAPNECFIEDMFPISIRNTLSIDCEITQPGFPTMLLSRFLKGGRPLKKNRSLRFFLVETDAKKPYRLYWKVRNCGEQAYRQKMIRGEISKDEGRYEKKESTSFTGNHSVECYIVKNGICIARDRIGVPIDVEV